jgi:hypothetical protein
MGGGMALLVLATAAAAGSLQEPPAAGGEQVPKAVPAPSTRAGAPDPGAQPLKVDIGKAIAEVVARMLESPRFEAHVEVHDRYQEALDSHLRAEELACGATASGPPPYDEMARFRETRIPPHADLLAGAKWLAGKLKRQGTVKDGRYYLYSVTARSAPGRVVLVVRDGAISEASRSSVAGTNWELVGRYADRSSASEAVARLQRGGPVDGSEGARVLWAAPACPR